MKDIMFKNLIEDIYQVWKNQTENRICCLLYGAVSTYGFSDIMDIQDFTSKMNPDMLHIKNSLDEEVDIYELNLVGYKIEDGKLYLDFRNGMLQTIK